MAERVHRYAAQRGLVFTALTGDDGFLDWMHQAPGEVRPTILETSPNSRVVWSSLWPVSPTDTIEFDLQPEGAGTALHYRWRTSHPPDDRGVAITRQRLNRYLGGDLRGWVDSP